MLKYMGFIVLFLFFCHSGIKNRGFSQMVSAVKWHSPIQASHFFY